MNSVVELSNLVIERTLHEAIRRDILSKLRKRSDPLVVSSKVGEALEELSIGDPLKHLDLLPDEEVDPGDIVANNEELVTEELGYSFHVVADVLESLFVCSNIHMSRSLAFDVCNSSKHHVNVSFGSIGLPTETLRTVLVCDITHNGRTFCELYITIIQVWKVGEIQIHLGLHTVPGVSAEVRGTSLFILSLLIGDLKVLKDISDRGYKTANLPIANVQLLRGNTGSCVSLVNNPPSAVNLGD